MNRRLILISQIALTLLAMPAFLNAQQDSDRKTEEAYERASEEMELWAEKHSADWEKWAARFEKDMEKWASEQEKVWEQWAEKYSHRWEKFAKEMESGSMDQESIRQMLDQSMEMIGEMPMGEMMESLMEDMPLDSLEDLQGIVGDSIEEALRDLEANVQPQESTEDARRQLAEHRNRILKLRRAQTQYEEALKRQFEAQDASSQEELDLLKNAVEISQEKTGQDAEAAEQVRRSTMEAYTEALRAKELAEMAATELERGALMRAREELNNVENQLRQDQDNANSDADRVRRTLNKERESKDGDRSRRDTDQTRQARDTDRRNRAHKARSKQMDRERSDRENSETRKSRVERDRAHSNSTIVELRQHLEKQREELRKRDDEMTQLRSEMRQLQRQLREMSRRDGDHDDEDEDEKSKDEDDEDDGRIIDIT